MPSAARGAAGLPFDPDREVAELRAYLGDAYDDRRLKLWREQLDEEFERVGDEAELYRTSEAYLYNLTVFALSGTKLPYLAELIRRVPPGARLLDYGCGIGSDGLLLREAGYQVAFADFDNPSVRYLRWRLEQRGLEAEIYDLDGDEVPGGFDAAYAFDVIEHVQEPFQLLAEMERRARLVAVNLLEPAEDETVLHRDLPIADLIRHARRGRLVSYSRHWGRSHLIVYRPGERSSTARLASAAALARGRAGIGLERVRRRASRG